MNRDDLVRRFRRLNVWRAGGQRAPHKPLLVLWAIGRCLRGEPRMAPYSEVSQVLTPLLKRFGLPRTRIHPEHPFWRLQSDVVWEVTPCDRIAVTDSGDAKVTSLREENAHGGFLEDINATLRTHPSWAVHIAGLLLDAHFPPTLHEEVLQAVGLNSEFEYVRRKARDRHFSDAVLTAYGHQCVVCDFAIRISDMSDKPIALEAAHIRWHCKQGPDWVSNALALCALHHRLFDWGAFTLSNDYQIMVSDLVAGKGSHDMLGRFHSKTIILPHKMDDVPDPAFIDWHHQEVFRRR